MRKLTLTILMSLAVVTAASGLGSCGRGSSDSQSSDTTVRKEISASASGQSSTAASDSGQQAIDSNLPTVIDFYATWCGPCKMIAPLLDSIQQKYRGHLNVIRIDVDQDPATASSYGVSSIPTFVFLNKEGKEMTRLVGADGEALSAMAASLAELPQTTKQ